MGQLLRACNSLEVRAPRQRGFGGRGPRMGMNLRDRTGHASGEACGQAWGGPVRPGLRPTQRSPSRLGKEEKPMVTGINHITLAVRDVGQSCDFYENVVGCGLVARWPSGAYLVAGDAWIALVLDPLTRAKALPEYTHLAFSVEAGDYLAISRRIIESGPKIWKTNESEGASLYFEDPNGHKLEIHVGDLSSRLRSARNARWDGLEVVNPDV